MYQHKVFGHKISIDTPVKIYESTTSYEEVSLWKFYNQQFSENQKSVAIVLDVDGTLNENSDSLLSATTQYQHQTHDFMLAIATGRTITERLYSTKHQGKKGFANLVDLLIGQNGSVVKIGNKLYAIPFTPKQLNKAITSSLRILGLNHTSELFRGEHLCIHVLQDSPNGLVEKVCIPVAAGKDSRRMQTILSQYDSIVSAYRAGALTPTFYGLAIAEYLKRGMPDYLIDVLYEDELYDSLVTELTLVGADLTKKEELIQQEGIPASVQQHIADREPGTRGAEQDIHPDILDIGIIDKRLNMEAINSAIHSINGVTFGMGDQANDTHLFAVNYPSVVLPRDEHGGWSFSIGMAQKSKESGNSVCFIKPAGEEYGNNFLIGLMSCLTKSKMVAFWNNYHESEVNQKLKQMLLSMENN